MIHLVTAIFPDVPTARRAADELAANGFPVEHISVVSKEDRREELRSQTGYGDIIDRNAGRGAVAGSIFGAIAGGIVALVSLALPGGIIVAGPLAAALGGAAAGAAGGSLIGALVGTGIPEPEARQYERHIHEGRILVGVETKDATRASLAEQILQQAGARTSPHITTGGATV